jgi:hypothetical protein
VTFIKYPIYSGIQPRVVKSTDRPGVRAELANAEVGHV